MPSNIVSYEWSLDGSLHIAYEAEDNHIHEMVRRQSGSWRDSDITRTAGGPELEDAILVGSTWAAGKTQQIAYASGMNTNGHIYELVMYQEHPWSVEDILEQHIAAAPADGLALIGYELKAAGTKQLVYTGRDGYIHELSAGTTGLWKYTNLTQATQTPLAENALLAAYAWESNGTKHVVYASSDEHIHELVGQQDGTWQHTDLTQVTNAPLADGNALVAFVWEAGKTRQIVYTTNNGDIYELLSGQDGTWTFTDLTRATQSPLAAGSALAAFAWETGEAKQVVYVDERNHVQELRMPLNGKWEHSDLTQQLHLPLASIDVLVGNEWTTQFAKHVAYLDTSENPHIHSLLLQHGSQWEHTDVTRFTGSEPLA